MNIFFIRIVPILLLIASSAAAQSVPALVNYQGRLANPDGSPLPTADYELSFRIYDTNSGGTPVWGPQIFDGTTNGVPGHGARIPVVQGYFNVLLGPVDTNNRSLAAAFTAPNRFVEVTVSNRPPILPRQQILSTPFALRAEHAGNRAVGTNAGLGGVAVSPTVTHVSTATEPTIVPDLAVMIETSGRPVQVFLSAGTSGYAYIEAYDYGGDGLARAFCELWRDGSVLVGKYSLESSSSGGAESRHRSSLFKRSILGHSSRRNPFLLHQTEYASWKPGRENHQHQTCRVRVLATFDP